MQPIHNENCIIIGNNPYKVIDEHCTQQTERKVYLQSISLPCLFAIEFLTLHQGLNIAIQFRDTPDDAIDFAEEWTIWGMGKFFPSFKDASIKVWGLCLEPCIEPLPKVPSNRDITLLLTYLYKDSSSVRQIQKDNKNISVERLISDKKMLQEFYENKCYYIELIIEYLQSEDKV